MSPLPSAWTLPICDGVPPQVPSLGSVKYIRLLPPFAIPTGPQLETVETKCTVAGEAASTQARRSLAVSETQIVSLGPSAIDVGSAPTVKRVSTWPDGVILATVPGFGVLYSSTTQKSPLAGS